MRNAIAGPAMKKWSWYNDTDPYVCKWVRNLIKAGLVPDGEVDERSIELVQPDDVRGFVQCHFFCGIAGWSLALRLAGVPDDYPVWTGSPPCQDHSNAGAVWGVRSGIEGMRGKLVRPWLALVEHHAPGTVYFENVPGIKENAVAEIEGCLASAGYRVSKSKRSTADIAGFNLRERVWIAAHRGSQGQQEPWPRRSRAAFSDPRRAPPGDVWIASANRSCGMVDGFPARMDAIRAFGNAIDPWVAAKFISDTMP